MSAEQKPICVVIDANIWLQDSNLFMRTAMGSALLYILKQSKGKIGLPEIIEEELTRNIVENGLKAIEQINKGFKSIEVIMGFRDSYELPNKAQLEAAVKERLTDLEDVIIRIFFTFEHAKSALRRINEKTQPNGDKNQQFKDSAIWEAILELSDSHTIYFISDDNAFFKNRNKQTEELADNLLNECNKMGAKVSIYNNIASCLKALQQDVPSLDYSNIILTIDNLINSGLRRELATEIGFEITTLAIDKSSLSAFFTEINGKLALIFELCYHCIDIQNNGEVERTEALLRAKGDCLYEIDTQKISDIKMDRERIYWVEPSGEAGRRGVVYASGTATIGGSEQVNYTFREPVDFIRSPDLDRKKRVDKFRTKQDFFKQYSTQQRAILEIFLEKYIETGFSVFQNIIGSITKYPEFVQYGDAIKIITLFGSQEKLEKALNQLQNLLYSV